MSEFKVEVVRLGPIEKHPNADRLETTRVHGGYPCIIAKGDFKEGDLAVYVPVDAMVPASHPDFAFLVPEPVRKEDATDEEWAERLRRYDREKTGKVRIRAKKLRGEFSMGLLIPLLDAEGGEAWCVDALGRRMLVREGSDVQEWLGIEKYEPDESNIRRPGGLQLHGEHDKDDPRLPEYTDIEGLRRWGNVLVEGEEVVITEKIHGQNARFLYVVDGDDPNGKFIVGSRTRIKRRPHTVTEEERRAHRRALWRAKLVYLFWAALGRLFGMRQPMMPKEPRDVKMSNWWRVAIDCQLEGLLSMIPNVALYGEVYGPCQDLKYGTPDKLRFRAFDAMDILNRKWLDYDEFARICDVFGIERVPLLYRGPWGEHCRVLAEGQSTLPDAQHVREGIVVRPTKERTHPRLGRVILKLVGQDYLLRR